jgi:hypothetical protein
MAASKKICWDRPKMKLYGKDMHLNISVSTRQFTDALSSDFVTSSKSDCLTFALRETYTAQVLKCGKAPSPI